MTIAATTAAAASAATGASATAAAASTTLAGNFNTFLTLLTTQLQNQDPTSPLDTNQFTSQLVEFASVEQQINMNTNLGSLIGLTQAGALTQSAAMVGHQVAVTSTSLPLQNGGAALQYTLTAAQPVTVSVSNASGVEVAQADLQGAVGANTWTWNGRASDGTTAPDGLYSVAVTTAGTAPVAVPFAVLGTVTGVTVSNGAPQVALGPLSVPMSAVGAVVK